MVGLDQRGALRDSGQSVHGQRSEEHTSELQSRLHLVCRLLLEKKKKTTGGRGREEGARRGSAALRGELILAATCGYCHRPGLSLLGRPCDDDCGLPTERLTST